MLIERLDELLQRIQRKHSCDELLTELIDQTSDCGVTGLFVSNLPAASETIHSHILMRGWNQEWIDHYSQQNYVHHDPVAQNLTKTRRPYLWSELCTVRHLQPIQRQIMSEAGEAGLVDGLTIPIHGVQRTTCVSFSTDGRPIPHSDRDALRFMAIIVLDRIEEIRFENQTQRSDMTRQRLLAKREAECLYWAHRGCSSKVIGLKIGISYRTVDQYIGTAINKLNAANRQDAIRIAIECRCLTA